MRLHDSLSSGNGFKVRLLLAQLGIPFERIEYDIDKAETTTLGLTDGIPFVVGMDRMTADFLGRLDANRMLGEVLDAFAQAHDGAPDTVRASGVRMARELLELGLLVPSPPVDSIENR